MDARVIVPGPIVVLAVGDDDDNWIPEFEATIKHSQRERYQELTAQIREACANELSTLDPELHNEVRQEYERRVKALTVTLNDEAEQAIQMEKELRQWSRVGVLSPEMQRIVTEQRLLWESAVKSSTPDNQSRHLSDLLPRIRNRSGSLPHGQYHLVDGTTRPAVWRPPVSASAETGSSRGRRRTVNGFGHPRSSDNLYNQRDISYDQVTSRAGPSFSSSFDLPPRHEVSEEPAEVLGSDGNDEGSHSDEEQAEEEVVERSFGNVLRTPPKIVIGQRHPNVPTPLNISRSLSHERWLPSPERFTHDARDENARGQFVPSSSPVGQDAPPQLSKNEMDGVRRQNEDHERMRKEPHWNRQQVSEYQQKELFEEIERKKQQDEARRRAELRKEGRMRSPESMEDTFAYNSPDRSSSNAPSWGGNTWSSVPSTPSSSKPTGFAGSPVASTNFPGAAPPRSASTASKGSHAPTEDSGVGPKTSSWQSTTSSGQSSPTSVWTSSLSSIPSTKREWLKNQEELARKQREQFQQELLEKKQPGAAQVIVKAWNQYEKAWVAMKDHAALGFHTIPWPVLTRPNNTGELTTDAISMFVLSPHHSQNKVNRCRLKEELRRWHHDRFETKWLSKVNVEDKKAVKRGAWQVMRCLTELTARERAVDQEHDTEEWKWQPDAENKTKEKCDEDEGDKRQLEAEMKAEQTRLDRLRRKEDEEMLRAGERLSTMVSGDETENRHLAQEPTPQVKEEYSTKQEEPYLKLQQLTDHQQKELLEGSDCKEQQDACPIGKLSDGSESPSDGALLTDPAGLWPPSIHIAVGSQEQSCTPLGTQAWLSSSTSAPLHTQCTPESLHQPGGGYQNLSTYCPPIRGLAGRQQPTESLHWPEQEDSYTLDSQLGVPPKQNVSPLLRSYTQGWPQSSYSEAQDPRAGIAVLGKQAAATADSITEHVVCNHCEREAAKVDRAEEKCEYLHDARKKSPRSQFTPLSSPQGQDAMGPVESPWIKKIQVSHHDVEALSQALVGASADAEMAMEEAEENLIVIVEKLQFFIDELHAKHRLFERFLKKIVLRRGILPPCLFVSGVRRIGTNAVAGGGFADVWRGEYSGRQIALKVLRIYDWNAEGSELRREFYKEAMTWRQLKHRHILPFYGVCTDEFSPQYAMVSPWMEKGSLPKYLKRYPDANRLLLIEGITLGLHYLHSLKPQVIHGDLRGANVLIDDQDQPRLADFGLSRTIDSQATVGTASSYRGQGNARWQAPELLQSGRFEGDSGHVTAKSDVYAVACVYLEVFTGEVPFQNLRDGNVIMEVAVKDRRPSHPGESATQRGLNDHIWDIMQDCWKTKPADRPAMGVVASRVIHAAMEVQ